ncbi:hypothetical protein LYNGBM3L_33040, partial [Moorena producens 3L]
MLTDIRLISSLVEYPSLRGRGRGEDGEVWGRVGESGGEFRIKGNYP